MLSFPHSVFVFFKCASIFVCLHNSAFSSFKSASVGCLTALYAAQFSAIDQIYIGWHPPVRLHCTSQCPVTLTILQILQSFHENLFSSKSVEVILRRGSFRKLKTLPDQGAISCEMDIAVLKSCPSRYTHTN